VRSPSRRILFLTVFIDLMGFGIVVPIMAWCAKEYGASGLTLGMVLASFSLMQFFFAPIWGRLSDHVGRRPVLMVSMFGNVVGFAMFGLAANVIMLFLSRIICGAAAASISTAQAYVADTTDEANRSKGMASITLAFGLGLVLGPPIGGILAALSTRLHLPANRLPGAAAALFSAIALLMTAVALAESRVPDRSSAGRPRLFDIESWRIFFRSRGLRLAGGSLAALMLTLASVSPILVLVGRDRFGLGAVQVAYLFGLMGLVVMLLAAFDPLTRRLGDLGTAITGAGCLMAGMLLLPLTHARAGIIAATCLMGAGQGLCNPTLSAYISKIAPASHRGGILGVSTSLNALARVLGPPLAGLAYDAFQTAGAVVSQAAVIAIGIVLAGRMLWGGRGEPFSSSPDSATISQEGTP
jgi:DHA1 family tetracycline resistance protein-like MFS transporter